MKLHSRIGEAAKVGRTFAARTSDPFGFVTTRGIVLVRDCLRYFVSLVVASSFFSAGRPTEPGLRRGQCKAL
jgi:hypothetical protein